MKVKEHAKMRKIVEGIPGDAPAALVAYIDPRKGKVIMVPFGTDAGLNALFSQIYGFVDDVVNGRINGEKVVGEGQCNGHEASGWLL